MKKTSNIIGKIIGLSLFLTSGALYANPGMDIDDTLFSIGQIGSFMDNVQDTEVAPALQHENPAILKIEMSYRQSNRNEMAQTLQRESLLNTIQMNNHAVYVQLKF